MTMRSALITGAGSGIGAALAKRLASEGVHVSVVDLDGAAAQQTAESINADGGHATGVQCDVTDAAAQSTAFREHAQRHGGVDVAVLNAGILESGSFLDNDDERGWRRMIDVNLTAALHGVRLAARAMSAAGGGNEPRGGGGTIMVVASAGGIFPVPGTPIYAGAKAALVHFVRSIEGQLKARGIRIVALCPQVTETALTVQARKLDPVGAKQMQGEHPPMSVDRVVDCAVMLLQNASLGPALVVFQHGLITEYPSKRRVTLPSDGVQAKL